jgi:hypothetical protein
MAANVLFMPTGAHRRIERHIMQVTQVAAALRTLAAELGEQVTDEFIEFVHDSLDHLTLPEEVKVWYREHDADYLALLADEFNDPA